MHSHVRVVHLRRRMRRPLWSVFNFFLIFLIFFELEEWDALQVLHLDSIPWMCFEYEQHCIFVYYVVDNIFAAGRFALSSEFVLDMGVLNVCIWQISLGCPLGLIRNTLQERKWFLANNGRREQNTLSTKGGKIRKKKRKRKIFSIFYG